MIQGTIGANKICQHSQAQLISSRVLATSKEGKHKFRLKNNDTSVIWINRSIFSAAMFPQQDTYAHMSKAIFAVISVISMKYFQTQAT